MSTFSDDLIEKITKEYDELKNHAEIKNMMKAIEHSSSYEDAYNLAKKVSNKLANIMSDNLPSDAYYGTLMAILEPSINNLYKDIDKACKVVQTNKNKEAGFGTKPQSAKRSKDVNSIMAHKLSLNGDYETVLQDYSCEIVDKNLKANMEFADALGYGVKITRKYDGIGLRNRKVDCTWCMSRAGTRTFKNATEAGESGMLARHQGCGCIIEYENTKTRHRSMLKKGKVEELAFEEQKTSKFKKANSIVEAEEYARQNLVVPPKYVGEGKVNFKGLPLDVVNEINEELTNLLSEYDVPKLTNLGVMNFRERLFKNSKNAPMSCVTNGGIFINPNICKSKKSIENYFKAGSEAYEICKNNYDKASASQKEIIDRYLKAGRQIVADDAPDKVKALLDHEFGHFIHFKKLTRDEVKIAVNNLEEYAPKISGYASQNSAEYIAESFCAYMNGEKNKVDDSMIKIFENIKK